MCTQDSWKCIGYWPRVKHRLWGQFPYHKGVISELYQRPDKSYFQECQEFENLINTSRLVQMVLPKQTDLDKILKIIQRKVLKVQTGYLVSPYFKDMYLFLAQNKLPHTKTAIWKVETLAEKYDRLDSLLFKIINVPEIETALMAVP